MMNAQFIGYLDIPGKYTVIDSVIFDGDLFLITKTDAAADSYVLYRVNLETAETTPITVEADDDA